MIDRGKHFRTKLRWLFWIAPLTALVLIVMALRLGLESDQFVKRNFDVYQSARYILKTSLIVQKGWGMALDAIYARDADALAQAAVTVEAAAAFIQPLTKMQPEAVTETSEEDILAFAEKLHDLNETYLEKELAVPLEEVTGLQERAAHLFDYFAVKDREHYGALSIESAKLKEQAKITYTAMALLGALIMLLMEVLRRMMRAELRAERELQAANDNLEQRVVERTRELAKANAELRHEVAERLRAEEARTDMEQQMLHSQKLESLGVLAGGIAHDFNNMLQGVLGNTELALEFIGPESGVRKYLKAIEGTVIRAGDIVKQMLTYSGKGLLISQSVDMNELSREMVGFLGAVISKKAVIDFNAGKNLPRIDADPSQIRQVVMNLIVNASEALEGKKGTITIKTGEVEIAQEELLQLYAPEAFGAGSYVYLSVSDDGCGMDKTTKERMFDPFFSTKFAGRGLGMAAVLGITKAHKGAFRIESAPGEGTEICLFFPHGKKRADRLEATVGGGYISDSEFRDKQLTVLLADDEPTVLAAAEQYLSECGWVVLSARNGREALELFHRHSAEIDIAVLDVAMPELDGNETFHLIRQENPTLPVLMCSGYTEQHLAILEEEDSASAFLAKPYLPSVLVAKVQDLCACSQPL